VNTNLKIRCGTKGISQTICSMDKESTTTQITSTMSEHGKKVSDREPEKCFMRMGTSTKVSGQTTNSKTKMPLTLIRVELNMLASLLMAKRQDLANIHIQTEQSITESGMMINKREMVPTYMQTKKFLKANGKITDLSYPKLNAKTAIHCSY